MRIIAGIAKGTPLKGRRTKYLRPTSDMVREGLFNMLGNRIPGSSFLDLYAGTGAVGIEALSRGASAATFVERRAELAELVRENLEKTHLAAEAKVICADATRAVARLTAQGERFDFVFADPPYYTDTQQLLDQVHMIMKQEGILICQHSRNEAAPLPAGLERTDQRPFGDTVLSFYRAAPAASPNRSDSQGSGGKP